MGKAGMRGNLWLEEEGIAINHLYIPKIQIKSNNIERKRRESNPAKEKSGSENQGVTNLPPLEKSRPRDFRAYLPAEGTYLWAAPRIHPPPCLLRFAGLLTVSLAGLMLSFQTVALNPSLSCQVYLLSCDLLPGVGE